MMRLRSNLNYFIALSFVVTMSIAWWVPSSHRAWASLGAIVAIGVIWWWKKSIVPVPYFAQAALALRVGTIAISIGNLLLALSVLTSAAGLLLVRDFGIAVGFILAAAVLVAFPVSTFGIACIEMARLLNIRPRLDSPHDDET